MTEIEPTIENVQPGEIVTVETGTPGEPGYAAFTVRVTRGAEPGAYTRSLDWVAGRARRGADRITRITRPAPPIPTEPGERFWARYKGVAYMAEAEEFVVASRNGEVLFVSLHDGLTWTPEEHGESFTVVPAPEPETVPVPADLIREAEEWDAGTWRVRSGGESILGLIVRAIREARKEKDDE